MKIIGVTGGIGAGKSSVSLILKELGAKVIDADRIAHEVVERGKPAWHKIGDAFGKEVLQADGSLNRKKIAHKIFNDEALRLKLEAIVHEWVIRAIRDDLEDLKSQGYDGLVVLDVPIPVEHGFLDTVDTVWVVTASEEIRIKRIIARNGLSYKEAQSRIRAQLTQEEYSRLAHELIENEETFEALKIKVKALVQKLKNQGDKQQRQVDLGTQNGGAHAGDEK